MVALFIKAAPGSPMKYNYLEKLASLLSVLRENAGKILKLFFIRIKS
jgi:hypothetical protein